MKRKDMPDDCCVIQAKMVRVGDRVRFRMTSADYTVEQSEVDGCISLALAERATL